MFFHGVSVRAILCWIKIWQDRVWLVINDVMMFIRGSLDQHLVNSFSLDEGVTVINGVIDPDGALPHKNQNKLIITLINLAHETSKQYYGGKKRSVDGDKFIKSNPAVHFNLDVLFTACFEDYEESLKVLAETIAFFQGDSSFDAETYPGIPEGLSGLSFEVESLNFHDMHGLWSSMGAKYQPSIIYKVKHITIQRHLIDQVVGSVGDLRYEVGA